MSQALTVQKRLSAQQMRYAISEICEKNNYNPFEELIKLATEVTVVEIAGKSVEVKVCDANDRIAIAKEIAQYLAPKYKAQDTEEDPNSDKNAFTITIKNFTRDHTLEVSSPALPDATDNASN